MTTTKTDRPTRWWWVRWIGGLLLGFFTAKLLLHYFSDLTASIILFFVLIPVLWWGEIVSVVHLVRERFER